MQRLLNDKNNGCHDFELLYYRILTIIGGCTPPIFGYFYKKINPNAIDPISIQLIFTALFFIAFILTFYLSYRKYIRVFITVISYLFIVWLVIFNIINRFPSEHALTLICLLSILTLWFNSIEKVHLYVCPLIFIIFVSVYMVTETQIMKQVFLYLLCAFFAFSYLVARAKYKLQQKLMASEMFKRTIFEESPDALIIVDNDTDEIIECNGKAMALFNVKEKNDLIGENYYTIAGFRDYNIDISRVKSMIDSEGIWEKEFLVGSEVGKSMCNAITLKKLMILEQMYVLVKISDITERKKNEEQIKYLAYHDGLTNLPNRRLAEEEIKAAMSQAELKNMKVGIMFIDLDKFKVVNDTLGHDIGDLLLIEAAERLKQSIRHKDIVSRLGGDEFMIVLKDISNSKQITDVAQRIIHTFATPFTIDKNIMKVTCSIGITVYPDEGEDVISLLKNADQAMYKVKQTGRNNYQFLNEYAS